MNTLGILVLIFFSIIFLLSGLIFLQANLYKISNWKKANAVVVEHEEGFDEDAAVYGAVVKFSIGNEDYIAKTGFQSSFPKSIGRKLEIRYNPEDPESYVPYSLFSLYVAPCIFVTIGILPIGIILYFFLGGY